MDIQTVDQQYAQLQTQSQQTVSELSTLANKLRVAAQAGNQDAREWMLDLKEIALAMQAEQNQMAALLQALHGFVANQAPPAAAPSPWGNQTPQPGYQQQPYPQAPYPQQPYPPQPYPQQPYPQQQPGGGMLGSFMNSGFGRAITMGAGFGIGDDIINGIFRAL